MTVGKTRPLPPGTPDLVRFAQGKVCCMCGESPQGEGELHLEATRDSMGEAGLRTAQVWAVGMSEPGILNRTSSSRILWLHFPLVASVFPHKPSLSLTAFVTSTNVATAWSHLAPSRSQVGPIPVHLHPPLCIRSFRVIVAKVHEPSEMAWWIEINEQGWDEGQK